MKWECAPQPGADPLCSSANRRDRIGPGGIRRQRKSPSVAADAAARVAVSGRARGILGRHGAHLARPGILRQRHAQGRIPDWGSSARAKMPTGVSAADSAGTMVLFCIRYLLGRNRFWRKDAPGCRVRLFDRSRDLARPTYRPGTPTCRLRLRAGAGQPAGSATDSKHGRKQRLRHWPGTKRPGPRGLRVRSADLCVSTASDDRGGANSRLRHDGLADHVGKIVAGPAPG